MSKSLNNFILAKDFIKEHTANVIKIALFNTHYRLPINLTSTVFEEAQNIDTKIKNVLKKANLHLKKLELVDLIGITKDQTFEEYMNDDFNTPNVITHLLNLVKELNAEIRNYGDNVLHLTNAILTITDVLGLVYDMPKLTEEQIELFNKWDEARNNKDFEKADEYRNKLIEENIL